LIAADAVLVASGTATLETLLVRRPMVVAYRFSALTAFLLRGLGLVKVTHFSQPNLLTGQSLVPEFLQEAVNGEDLGRALLKQLTDSEGRTHLEAEFLKVHRQLRVGAADRAAQAVLELVNDARH
jgi:lipid-A-disaccharide synthase